MAVQIQLRRDTAANWTSVNPVLARGEPGYETDTGKLKIGDGSTVYTLLPFFSTPSAAHALGGTSHTPDTLANLNSKVTDATLIDTNDFRLFNSRTPTAHPLAGIEHSPSTLVALNGKVSDANLIASTDPRLSDDRFPLSHANHVLADITNAGALAGKNTVDTVDINNKAVTFAKIQDVSATSRLLGRVTAGAGVVEEIGPAAARTILNVEDGATADQTGAEIKTAYENNLDTNAYTDDDEEKVSFISVSQAVDLDQIKSDTQANNAKETNATHTGEVTGAVGLVVQSTAISNKGTVTVSPTDEVLISDVSDSGNLKKVTAQAIADLTPTSIYTHPDHTGEVDSVGDGAQTLNSLAISNKTQVVPVGADFVLIGDTSDSDNLKKVLVSALMTATVFGTEYESFEDITESSTTSLTFVEQASFTTASLPAGDYHIIVSMLGRTNASNRSGTVRVQLDNTIEILGEAELANAQAGNNSYAAHGDFTLTAATHQIDVDIQANGGGSTAFISQIRVEIWRTS